MQRTQACVGYCEGCAGDREARWSSGVEGRVRTGGADQAAEEQQSGRLRRPASACARAVLKPGVTRSATAYLPWSATGPPFARATTSRSPTSPTPPLTHHHPTSIVIMADTFPCGCLVSDESIAHDCGAASYLPAVPALGLGGGGTLLSVGGTRFMSCPCCNLMFLHDLTCAYFGGSGLAESAVHHLDRAPEAGRAAQTVTTTQGPAAAPIDEGGALSLTRDGLCVVSSVVRPRNDTGEDDDVITVAERVQVRPM